MHYEMKPYQLSALSNHRTPHKVVLKRESEAIHVGCVTEGMDNDRVGYNATTAQCGIQVCSYVISSQARSQIFMEGGSICPRICHGGLNCT